MLEGFWWKCILGCALGVLSGMGVGGGSLLIVILSSFLGYDQTKAQGINLLYFLPTSAAALVMHFKHGSIDKKTAVYAAVTGVVFAVSAGFLASGFEPGLLRKLFGGLILAAGLFELFSKEGKPA